MKQLLNAAALAALVTLSSTGLSAQSISAGDGLGSPIESLDARSRALGGVGVGLRGDDFVPTDPASVADLFIPSLSFSLQSSWIKADEAGVASNITATRFPVVGVAYPVNGVGVVSLSFGSILDQGWQVSQSQTISLGGTGTEAKVTDEFFSEGGVAALRLGFARRVSSSLALGATVGTYTGDVTRAFTRTFDSILVETTVPPFQVGGQWRYSGLNASMGAAFDFGEILRLAGTYSFGGTMNAKPSDETDGGADEFSMPNDLRIGASALLAPELSLTAGFSRADWTETGKLYPDSEGFAASTWGTGLEYSGGSFLGKPSAYRLGYRSVGLPFAPTGSEDPSESMFALGIGMDLLTNGDLVVANADFALERGSRSIGSVTEDFWRFALSIRVSGS